MAKHENTLVLILAAGQGTRMLSSLPKVLHPLGGLPLIGHVLKSVACFSSGCVGVVLSSDESGKDVEAYIRSYPLAPHILYQDRPLGTGHAVLSAKSLLEKWTGPVLILFGDTPLVRSETLTSALTFFEEQQQRGLSPSTVALSVGMIPQDPKQYGRIVTDHDQNVLKIVESNHLSKEEKSTLSLCNAGVMILDGRHALSLVQSICPNPVTGEFYLTDIVSIARTQGHQVALYEAHDSREFEGVNTRSDLAWAEKTLQQRWREKAMEEGVTLIDPDTLYLSHDTQLGKDVTLHPCVVLGPGVTIEDHAQILPFSHIEGAHIKKGARIGPYARLRPETTVEEKAQVGNFVELKKTTLGQGSKVNHLAYLGDTHVGARTNVGAGVITCNYDGHQKWQTQIGQNVFIGANSALVAPVSLGDGAVVAAGTIVTRDVPKNALTIGRTRQVDLPEKGNAFRLKTKIKITAKSPKEIN